MTLDLFTYDCPVPADIRPVSPTARAIAIELQAAEDPTTVLRKHGFGIGGNCDRTMIVGYGVEGTGATQDEAIADWCAGVGV